MAKRILVPIGDDARAEAIVPLVAALARDGGGTVRLLNVQPLQRTRRLPVVDERDRGLFGGNAGVAQRRSLIGGWEKSRTPVIDAAVGQRRVLERHGQPCGAGVILARFGFHGRAEWGGEATPYPFSVSR